ncbi:MFS transporter [Microbulbifer agarilyticus]|uniref:MFS transporter n=1 Tax=Microbulbifer agarilyticus TaxID=260552 RepID=A0A1Q2M9P2_9GAMM|nr:MFS transporter [Microbulbifer agarilyticus]AQQ69406.1 MFS transporter [Microbulbifer agarilyticus]
MDRQWWQSLYGLPPLIWIVLVGSFFGRGTYFMVWPFLAVMLHQKFALSPAEIGALLSVSAMCAAILGFYTGALSDRFGRKLLLLCGTFINVIAFAFLAFADSVMAFAVAITLSAVGRSVWEPPAMAMFGDLIPDTKARELAMQFRYFLINVGSALGPIIGVWIGLSGQQTTFGITAFSYLSLFVAFIVAFRVYGSEKPSSHGATSSGKFSDTLRVLAQDKVFLITILANVIALFIYAHMDSSLIQYLTINDAPKVVTLISSMILINASTIVCLQFPLLRLMRDVNVNQRIFIGMMLLAAGQIWFALNPIHWFSGWLGAIFLISVAEAILFPNMSVQVDRMAPANMRGSYFGATSLYAFGWSSAPLVGGLMIQFFGGPALYLVTFALCLLVMWMYWHTGNLMAQPVWPKRGGDSEGVTPNLPTSVSSVEKAGGRDSTASDNGSPEPNPA